MPLRDRLFIIIILLALMTGSLLVSTSKTGFPENPPLVLPEELPDFTVYADVQEKKSAFFQFLLPYIDQENERILQLRDELVSLDRKISTGEKLTSRERRWFYQLASRYRVATAERDDADIMEVLLRRVDIIPPSMALSQSANESAWGTSRFAVEGNNLFGQWCFSPGCGIVPERRPEGARYEVAHFDTPAASIRSYIHNLNTNAAYTDFRLKRADLRASDQPLSGMVLASELENYSIRRDAYIEEVQAMIRINKLAQYDGAEDLPGSTRLD